MAFLKSLFGAKEAKIVEISPSGLRFEVPSGQTMLEAALAQGLAYPHNCTVGTCGSCKTKLTSGRVRALLDFGYTLSQQELAAGYILACQSVPKDALTQVEVEIEDASIPKPETFTGKLAATEELTHDILRVTIELDHPMKFIAGQYINLKFSGVDRARNYSFADAPVNDGRPSVNFFVRKIPGGALTEALFAGKLKDETLEVDGPHGNFHLRSSNAPMICIAGGSGLAPLLSVLEHAVSEQVKRPCVMLFGARTQADLYCIEQIQAISKKWAGKFVFTPVLSHEPEDSSWTGERGLVTQFIADALPGIDWSQAQGYMCGPPGMIDAGIASLTEYGVKLEAIYYDKFTDESHASTMP